jgi:hypothetical protein
MGVKEGKRKKGQSEGSGCALDSEILAFLIDDKKTSAVVQEGDLDPILRNGKLCLYPESWRSSQPCGDKPLNSIKWLLWRTIPREELFLFLQKRLPF